nr:hypothetical protein [Asticcacaulis excentricus]
MHDCQCQSQIVLADIDQVREPPQKAKYNQNISMRSDGNARIALFKTRDGTWRGPRTQSEICNGDATPQARVADILS